jgi:hypothetical protein
MRHCVSPIGKPAYRLCLDDILIVLTSNAYKHRVALRTLTSRTPRVMCVDGYLDGPGYF